MNDFKKENKKLIRKNKNLGRENELLSNLYDTLFNDVKDAMKSNDIVINLHNNLYSKDFIKKNLKFLREEPKQSSIELSNKFDNDQNIFLKKLKTKTLTKSIKIEKYNHEFYQE